MSNNSFKQTLNVSFSVTAVSTLFWPDLVDIAWKRKRWSEDVLRAKLAEEGVSSGNVTNWKGTVNTPGRPIPPKRFQMLAELFGITMDELQRKAFPPAQSFKPITLPFRDEDWQRVPSSVKSDIIARIDTAIATSLADDPAPRGRRPTPTKIRDAS